MSRYGREVSTVRQVGDVSVSGDSAWDGGAGAAAGDGSLVVIRRAPKMQRPALNAFFWVSVCVYMPGQCMHTIVEGVIPSTEDAAVPFGRRERNGVHRGYNSHGRLDAFLDTPVSNLPEDLSLLASDGATAGVTVNAEIIQKPLEELPMQQDAQVMIPQRQNDVKPLVDNSLGRGRRLV